MKDNWCYFIIDYAGLMTNNINILGSTVDQGCCWFVTCYSSMVTCLSFITGKLQQGYVEVVMHYQNIKKLNMV